MLGRRERLPWRNQPIRVGHCDYRHLPLAEHSGPRAVAATLFPKRTRLSMTSSAALLADYIVAKDKHIDPGREETPYRVNRILNDRLAHDVEARVEHHRDPAQLPELND